MSVKQKFPVMSAKNVDINKITFSSLKKLPNGAKISYVNYGNIEDDGIVSLQMVTPMVDFPFDAKFFADENGGKWSCKVALKGDSDAMNEFIKTMTQFDDKIKSEAIKNSQAWFGKKSLTEDVMLEKYTPIVRPYKEPETGEETGKYAPQLAFKVPFKNDKYECKFYDENKDLINITDKDGDDYKDIENILKKGISTKMILKCNGMWFSASGFGCTWKAVQMKVKVPVELDSYAFDDTDDDDDDDDDDAASDKYVMDSTEEEESDEEVIVKKSNRKGSK